MMSDGVSRGRSKRNGRRGQVTRGHNLCSIPYRHPCIPFSFGV
jgi:hypothetical protein